MNFIPFYDYNMHRFYYLNRYNPNYYNNFRQYNNYYRQYRQCNIDPLPLKEENLQPKNFRITYPFVQDIGNENISKFVNESIVNEVSNLFKEQVLTPGKGNIQEAIGFYEVKLNKNCLLSILFGMYTYYEGAAHGFTAYSSLNIDLNTGQVLQLNDLFTSRINYKPILEEKVREYISKNNVPLIEEYNGLHEDQQFYLTPDSLVLYYQVYEYTPYSYGLFQIPIPYKDILNLLGPASPIQRLLK
ncbi:DUF3298 and DUF4163 domain-containing protein [Clostridium sporogenes]|uniref:DUF3298 domain-containing protein n=2 Tax=Clostridium TaxID=1485 RepID=A0A6M0T2T9_CLOBO|nr:DUF3298 and DUF4163 domain-containing protein [Clostridium sporogenes]NFA61445.1 DUF3298 domain-containing protein [Clostridium botulinum]MDS1002785.1 DUF3298 domain-containing protein [Clostridium sporogenes]NFI72453.1 DUF3298 and DUF4163 domain-containing protein [Clostridium sporogenes]NFP60699.1 DUF3298 and DUF4163 domain-containing protein [Clostridium sporogenes]NFU93748.1 DUF3298 and DUF4163 domain-containing protein [Clostridium sporogenes]